MTHDAINPQITLEEAKGLKLVGVLHTTGSAVLVFDSGFVTVDAEFDANGDQHALEFDRDFDWVLFSPEEMHVAGVGELPELRAKRAEILEASNANLRRSRMNRLADDLRSLTPEDLAALLREVGR